MGVFEGHSHYVMGIALNPKDSNTFASVSLDKTIKVSAFIVGGLLNFLDLESEFFDCFKFFSCF